MTHGVEEDTPAQTYQKIMEARRERISPGIDSCRKKFEKIYDDAMRSIETREG